MKTLLRMLRSKVGLLGVCMVAAAISGWAAAKWRVVQRAEKEKAREEEYRKMTEVAVGRAEFVSGADLVSAAAKYDGKRVILTGVWSQGFEHSSLHLQDVEQDFLIWVDADWSKIDAPMGDFSNRKKNADEPKTDQNGHLSFRIIAEGTFHYRHHERGELFGYGHMGVSEGYFLIDRLFQFEWTETEPNPEGSVERSRHRTLDEQARGE